MSNENPGDAQDPIGMVGKLVLRRNRRSLPMPVVMPEPSPPADP
ncbi:MAG: hypothetical protein QUS11_05050 [Candidatus Fermentibacter sp.]|nr:hypothetical protein [Candidatus Fermentibacter sp.]